MKQPHQKFTVVVVDDESPARTTLKYLLQKEQDFEIVAECANGRDAINAVRLKNPDLILLDIHMPEIDGFEVIRRLRVKAIPHVIFVTAYDEFALKAFEVHAIDYILKPAIPSRFAESIDHARRILRSGGRQVHRSKLVQLLRDIEHHPHTNEDATGEVVRKNEYLSQLIVRNKLGMRAILVDNVDWIEAADHYVFIHSGSTKILLEKSLADLERHLNPKFFLRIRRNVIVNLRSITQVHAAKFGAMTVILRAGHKLTTSRLLGSDLRKKLILSIPS